MYIHGIIYVVIRKVIALRSLFRKRELPLANIFKRATINNYDYLILSNRELFCISDPFSL